MIDDNIYKNPIQSTSNNTQSKMTPQTFHMFVKEEETTSSLDIMSVQNNEDLENVFDEFIDIPNLVSDDELSEEDTVSTKTFGSHWKRSGQSTPATVASEPRVSRRQGSPPQYNKSEQVKIQQPKPIQPQAVQQQQQQQPLHINKAYILPSQQLASSVQTATRKIKTSSTTSTAISTTTKATTKSTHLSPEQFKYEQTQLMTIIVKYIATKIYNSFPPESPRSIKPNEMPLDKFLLLLTSRLQLTLPLFIKGIIYLFRYMDIIYLLRYLNQSNNFINYKDMGFELKKLIVGCFKLTIIKERRIPKNKNKYNYNWQHITGLSNQEINNIVKQIVGRMNGKLRIKDVELLRMKSEIFRFVKMVTKEV
ncbi:uncharacterized protein SPAPADRAFT_60455 [Spathaspora passalidarum NRRL Y-27907]|uniref:Uncharacterized protein n=1 Tax=Spathaspora passalidarum (strain NRRL Y-27907 / 11-Y1) TaxID=619300 RepID=G3ALA9_SPAPN|nr:uncharacterized protein SPAPADRAFT_60455 [Spathaspora passalidarum NRRL Y-27907]EGW33152.1 hypothetical protein SPAPADRAFT_60455 [Spathaspora passalidarum NRRL Y-27907]